MRMLIRTMEKSTSFLRIPKQLILIRNALVLENQVQTEKRARNKQNIWRLQKKIKSKCEATRNEKNIRWKRKWTKLSSRPKQWNIFVINTNKVSINLAMTDAACEWRKCFRVMSQTDGNALPALESIQIRVYHLSHLISNRQSGQILCWKWKKTQTNLSTLFTRRLVDCLRNQDIKCTERTSTKCKEVEDKLKMKWAKSIPQTMR